MNRQASNMSTGDVKNKMKTLSEGAFTDRVLSQVAGTFTTLVKSADFAGAPEGGMSGGLSDDGAGETESSSASDGNNGGDAGRSAGGDEGGHAGGGSPFGSLAYNINIQLPESRDPHLPQIMQQNWEHFEADVPRVDWATALFSTLERSRNVIMHSGSLVMPDIERIGVHIRDWNKQVSL